MFLLYGGVEELVVKGYVDASFEIDPDDAKSQNGYVYILNGGAVSWCNCKVHMDLNVADPLTKPLPRAKHDQHQNSMGVRFITM